jgi:serine/threonine-protein kinase ATR
MGPNHWRLAEFSFLDTLRTHVKGVLTRNPEWEAALAGFQVESSWMIGDWADVRSIVNQTQAQVPQVTIARLLLCMQQDDQKAIGTALNEARMLLGASISASGLRGHRQSHDALVDLHLVRELEFIHGASHQPRSKDYFGKLSKILEHRLDLTLPTFRNRERILSLRRTAFLLR